MQVNSGRNKEVADARGRALSGERGRGGGAHYLHYLAPCHGAAALPGSRGDPFSWLLPSRVRLFSM